MTLPPLLRLSYWFSINPPPFTPILDKAIFVIFTALLVAGIVVRLLAFRSGWDKLTKRLIVRSGVLLVGYGVFGLVIYAFTYERVPVLSMRIGYLIWLGLFVYSARNIVNYVWKEIPELRKREEERGKYNKWLPKPNV